MILLRGVQIVHFGSITGDERDIVIAACAGGRVRVPQQPRSR
jgi:hypothetical protein